MPETTYKTIPNEVLEELEAPFDTICSWWNDLDDNRGDRAELRRCRSLDKVLLSEAYHKLRLRVLRSSANVHGEQLASVAGILVHVKRHGDGVPSFARRMAQSRDGQSNPRVSLSRFKRFIRRDTREEVYAPFIRLVRSIETADVPSLAKDIYFWGDKRRKDWARDYYEYALDES